MPNLFGLNIAKIVNDSITLAGGVLSGTLTKPVAGTRTPGSLTGGTNPTTTTHTFEGFIEDKTETRREGSLVSEGGKFVSILGDSIDPVAEPNQGDEILIESITYRILAIVGRDPAAALFECRVEV